MRRLKPILLWVWAAGCVGRAIGAAPDGGSSVDCATVGDDKTSREDISYPVPEGMAYVSKGRAHKSDPATKVDAFFIDVREATVGQYRECVHAGRCPLPGRRTRFDADQPWEYCNYWQRGRDKDAIYCLNFWQARDYCEFRHKRLPTPDEWERAAGFEDLRDYPWGNQELGPADICWMRKPWQGTCKVGTHPKDVSPFGVLDMAGNAPEWTEDRSENCVGTPYCHQRILGTDWSYRPNRLFPTHFHRGNIDIMKSKSAWAGARCVQPF
jgi:formylglycine-generating enzyme required for sulfatase activity